MMVDLTLIAESAIAMLLLAGTFLLAGRVHPFQFLIDDPRTVASFSAGVSVAYAIIYAIPELCGARESYKTAAGMLLPFEGKVVYFLALAGFFIFYGLEHLRRQSDGRTGESESANFNIQISGFVGYVWLMSYMIVYIIEESLLSIVLYSVAISFHFLALDHNLRRENGKVYDKMGRLLLAGACVVGWGTSLLLPLPEYVFALLTAFISGAVIVNSTIMELPTEKDGRFLPFLAGGALYGILLLPLG
ncbi:hypothetical protein [Mesorhizobium jarvisii]|uniref:hypothetical protein n=1 Tax=Mesorhizobium jarvisii TaxID=1777867 RepID=UPI001F0AC5DF|nr:hypothetical protein [Mesorhizobium jarvisii]MCH4561033.1 hypothetical protein [Mesorhizobium jarvisii]